MKLFIVLNFVLGTFIFNIGFCELFTSEQFQYLPVGTKYRAEVSPPARPCKNKVISHMGGSSQQSDPMSTSNNTFNFMLGGLVVKSIIDVGCGKGITSKYFHDQGAKVLCVEGSHDAISQSLLPSSKIVNHDFTLGPWWPTDTYDAAWSVEFIEHVGRQHMKNYLPILHKSALIFIEGSGFGGTHHVEVHARWWWKSRLAAQGFEYSRDLTMEVRKYAIAGKNNNIDAVHIIHGMMVFINPAVASLPAHQHLFGGHGCYANRVDNANGGQPCQGSDSLSPQYEALLSCTVDRKNLWACQRNFKAIPLK